MSSVKEKIPGIIGGMGPEATVDLMRRIIINTAAIDDKDHIRCIVDNNPKIPSRIRAILGEKGENPGPCLADMAQRLEAWGADFLVIPCNTAHEYYSYISNAVKIPVVHLIDLVVNTVITQDNTIERVGLLGSNTIIKTELYTAKFAKKGVQVIYPDDVIQQNLFRIIRRVKKGETGKAIRHEFAEIGEHIADKGVDTIILGCTELGIITGDLSIAVIDAAEILAREIIDVAKNKKSAHVESIHIQGSKAGV